MFYGPSNKNLAHVIPYRPGPLDISRFNGSLPTKVIIHGFGSSCNRVWAHEMREALLFTVSCRLSHTLRRDSSYQCADPTLPSRTSVVESHGTAGQ